MLDLPLLDQILHGPRNVFNRDRGIDAMLIVEIDDIDSETLQGALDYLLDVLGLAIQAAPTRFTRGGGCPAKRRRDDDLIAERRQRFADQLLVRKRAIHFRGIEECDAAFHGRLQQSDHRFPVWDRRVRPAHAHAAEA
jgi:hypothetical protein